MQLFDCRGIPITAVSQIAVLRLDRAVHSFLSHRSDTGAHLENALAADPNLVLGHCFTAFLRLLLCQAEFYPEAAAALARAATSMACLGATRRERGLFEAAAAWLSNDMRGCAARLENLVADTPLDFLSFKLAHMVRFLLGDPHSMCRTAEITERGCSAETPDHGFVLGCHAFALEELGEFDLSARLAHCALEYDADDVWAFHAAVHVHQSKGDIAAGLALIKAGPHPGVNNLAYHLSWHEALFHLARNDCDAALDTYDRKVRPSQTDDYRDIANGASLLWRFERHGWSVGSRWEELADLAERHLDDGALVFAQLHYLLALVGAGRWSAVSALFEAMRQRSASVTGTQSEVLREIGLPLAQRLLGAASAHAQPVVPTDGSPSRLALWRVGGSCLQRDLFAAILSAHANMGLRL